MRQNTFLDRLLHTEEYCNQYERITGFELSELLGSTTYLLLLLCLSIPLFIFSTQWIVLPITAVCIMCAIWYSFDQAIWLPNFLKRKTFESKKLQTAAKRIRMCVESWLSISGDEKAVLTYWTIFQPLNIALIIVACFLTGFVPITSLWPPFTIFFLTLALLLTDGILSLLGYFTLLVCIL